MAPICDLMYWVHHQYRSRLFTTGFTPCYEDLPLGDDVDVDHTDRELTHLKDARVYTV